jgi:hypothetical protein
MTRSSIDTGLVHTLKAQGLSNRAIAAQLGCSPSTVSNHLKRTAPMPPCENARHQNAGNTPELPEKLVTGHPVRANSADGSVVLLLPVILLVLAVTECIWPLAKYLITATTQVIVDELVPLSINEQEQLVGEMMMDYLNTGDKQQLDIIHSLADDVHHRKELSQVLQQHI